MGALWIIRNIIAKFSVGKSKVVSYVEVKDKNLLGLGLLGICSFRGCVNLFGQKDKHKYNYI
jgi:hypothetical protein